MHVTMVYVHVKPEHVEAFADAARRNHAGSVREPGNLRFDVLQSADEPTRFVLVEVYRDAGSAAAHKETPHYLAWREEVAGWMASPRVGRRFSVVAPTDPEAW